MPIMIHGQSDMLGDFPPEQRGACASKESPSTRSSNSKKLQLRRPAWCRNRILEHGTRRCRAWARLLGGWSAWEWLFGTPGQPGQALHQPTWWWDAEEKWGGGAEVEVEEGEVLGGQPWLLQAEGEHVWRRGSREEKALVGTICPKAVTGKPDGRGTRGCCKGRRRRRGRRRKVEQAGEQAGWGRKACQSTGVACQQKILMHELPWHWSSSRWIPRPGSSWAPPTPRPIRPPPPLTGATPPLCTRSPRQVQAQSRGRARGTPSWSRRSQKEGKGETRTGSLGGAETVCMRASMTGEKSQTDAVKKLISFKIRFALSSRHWPLFTKTKKLRSQSNGVLIHKIQNTKWFIIYNENPNNIQWKCKYKNIFLSAQRDPHWPAKTRRSLPPLSPGHLSKALKMMNSKLEQRICSEHVIFFMSAIKYWVTFCVVAFCNLVTFCPLWDPINWTDTKVHMGSIGRHDMFALNKSQWTRTSSSSVITYSISVVWLLSTVCFQMISVFIFYFSRGQLGQNRALPQLLQWSDDTPKSCPTMSSNHSK